jgi:hypothetical protein
MSPVQKHRGEYPSLYVAIESIAIKKSLELATLQRVRWFNHHRLLEPIEHIPSVEAEANYWRPLGNTTETVTSI